METQRIYRVGIIGCGWIATEAPDNHLKAYRECKDTEVDVLCDINFEGDMYSYWNNYKEMLRSTNLDIVSVCTPVETHCQIVCDIAHYVQAIYCEKPIASTMEEADLMIATCKKYDTILQVNHQRTFMNPKLSFSRDFLDTGTHAYALIQHLFKDNIKVDVEYINGKEHIFEIDCTHNKKPMILKGVEELVACIEEGRQSVSSGWKAREALKYVLDRKKELGL